jgi:hypothetical protein
MVTAQATAREYLCKMIAEYKDDPYCLEIIQFFGWHPNTRFSGLAITHALSVNGERRYIHKALQQLVDKGVVNTYSENGVDLYCLTDNSKLRQNALDVAGIDWSQWQDTLRQSYNHLWNYMTPGHNPTISVIANS